MDPAFIGLLLQIILGRSDQEAIAQLNASERARLEEAFGGAQAAAQQARDLVGNVPQLNIGDFAAPPPIQSGTNATLNFTDGPVQGAISAGADGQLFFVSDQLGGNIPLTRGADGNYFVQDMAPGGSPISVTPTVDEGSAFRDIFDTLRSGVPNIPSAFQSANISSGDPFGDLGEFTEGLGDIGGGFLRRGDLGRINPESLLPDLQNPEAFRAEQESDLFARTGAASESERVGARRSLSEAGILPGSAAFQFESEQAPEQRRTEAVGEGLPQIEAQTQDLVARNAQFESEAARTAAGLNTQLAGIETGAINQQLQIARDAFLGGAGANTQAGGLRLDASREDANNAFRSFGQEVGLTQDQIDFFNTQIGLNASLSTQAAQIGTQVALSIIQAELADSPNAILNTDVFQNAISAGQQIANLFNTLSPPDTGGGGGNVFGELGLPGGSSVGGGFGT